MYSRKFGLRFTGKWQEMLSIRPLIGTIDLIAFRAAGCRPMAVEVDRLYLKRVDAAARLQQSATWKLFLLARAK